MIRRRIEAKGVVQGVGFRPFVYNAAREWGLTGWVRNEADSVSIEVQGEVGEVDSFLKTLRDAHPPQVCIAFLEVHEVGCRKEDRFRIRDSAGGAPPRPTIPADLATCGGCREEVRTPALRRFSYPFTNCTNCGPRYSIVTGLPYDRPRTSMQGFPMCPDCAAEYNDPTDRRFHAQPIACPRCGPQLTLMGRDGQRIAGAQDAIPAAARALRGGRIVALKGLGGFQLLVDASNPEAVARLRERKRRPRKPLAVMVETLESACAFCELSEEEKRELLSPAAPIVLLARQRQLADDLSGTQQLHAGKIAREVAPGNPYLGVMLPYTPLHHLLLEAVGRPLVCTSGNLSEEPMCTETDEALSRLGGIADLFLTHDRPIVRPLDDSVVRVSAEGRHVLRRARGFAPLPLELGSDGATVMAVGGHLKSTIALAVGPQGVLSQHIGDLDSALGVEVFERAVADLCAFFAVEPQAIVCDLHPDYASTRRAERFASQWDVPLLRVQHHQAHVASCAAEHCLRGPLLGLAWDGSGYGPDGTIWGGEAIVCDISEGAQFRRLAHLRPFGLPGGEKAIAEPRRAALGALWEFLGAAGSEPLRSWFAGDELRALLGLLELSLQAPRTTSVGRLFDAVAALCGLRGSNSFEGEAAMDLEFVAAVDKNSRGGAAYPFPLSGATDEPVEADWEPLLRAVLDDRERGVAVSAISLRFHQALAALAVAMARRSGLERVVLTGGCFQNALLSKLVRSRLLEAGFAVFQHHRVPPNDGGIAFGQLVVGREWLRRAGAKAPEGLTGLDAE